MSDGNRDDAREAPADENREGGRKKAFMSLFPRRDWRMNYSRGGEQENINLTLILNSNFAPPPPSFALAFKQTGAEGIVERSPCLLRLNL